MAEEVLTDFDQDIASIFTDEAVELIDAAQGGLAQWNENRGSVDGLAALKRPLHTLKGGARMAGLVPMGDLSHELETLFMQIDSGIVAPDDRAFALAQSALDELARMRESVSTGKGVPTAHGLIAKIHALSQPGSAAPTVAAAPAPVGARGARCGTGAQACCTGCHGPRAGTKARSIRRQLRLRWRVRPPAPKPAPAPVLAAVPTQPRPPAPARAEAAPEPPVLAPVWAPPEAVPSSIGRSSPPVSMPS